MRPTWLALMRSAQDATQPDSKMHTIRHRFASRAYRGTRNLPALQQLLGHSNLAVTERYNAVDDSEMRAAMVAAAVENTD